jgi:hypothetical protein
VNRLLISSLGFLMALWVVPGMAHHSAAMFDAHKVVTLSGTVKEFQWINPHCFIQLSVPEKNGDVEWSIEMGSPTQIYRSGWRPSALQPGDKVTIVIHPVRDGTLAGLFVSGTTRDGASLGAKRKEAAAS